MWKLFVTLALLVAAGTLRGPVVTYAKGGGDIVIGGGDLAPYYYAFREPPPLDLGWLGLLSRAADGGRPAPSAPPADSASLLAQSYDLYFGYPVRSHGQSRAARYARSGDGRTYLHYEEVDTALPSGWYALTDRAVQYVDRELAAARQAKAAGGEGMSTDALDEVVRHGRYYTGHEGTPSIISDEYLVSLDAEYTDGAAPSLGHIIGDDARGLLDAYIATLHNWHPTAEENAGGYHDFPLGTGRQQFSVFTPERREVFSFVMTADRSVLRVFAAEDFGGFFDPDPQLQAIMRQVMPPSAASSKASAPSTHEASRSAGIVAGSLAAGLLLALGIGTMAARRLARAVPD